MINRKLFSLIESKSDLSRPRIYVLISEKRKEYSFSISKELAAYMVAAAYSIDISKFATPEEREKLQNLSAHSTRTTHLVTRKAAKESTPVLVKIGERLQISDPLLPSNIFQQAKKMSDLYAGLYLFENSVRNLIRVVMAKKHGPNWWAPPTVPRGVREDVEKIRNKEKQNAWHSNRGAQPIFYTQIGHLKSIITSNWSTFEDLFPSRVWVETRIDEIEISRNTVAHHNPLQNDDVKQLELYIKQWFKQLQSISGKLANPSP